MVDFHLKDYGVEVTRINFWLLPWLMQIRLEQSSQNIFFKYLMLILKNNESDVYSMKKKTKIKIKFQKNEGYFFGQ